MRKYTLGNLVIEVTRRCPLACAHCLRGTQQNLDIDTDYIDRILESVEYVSSITFSGGEPALNVDAIRYTREKCRKLGIPVGCFYIVTNGHIDPTDLIIESLRWYGYAEEKDICGLALSKDVYHKECPIENEELLRGVAFFVEDKIQDFKYGLINEGNAKNIVGVKKKELQDDPIEIECIEENQYAIDSIIYLSANGEIRTECDAAYDNYRFTIGSIANQTFDSIIQNVIKETNAA